MTYEEITNKILGMFSKDMAPEERKLLIMLYDTCTYNKDWDDEPTFSLLRVKTSFDNITKKMSSIFNIKSSRLKYVDSDLYDKDMSNLHVDMESLNKIRENAHEFKHNSENKRDTFDKFKIELMEDYIMLEDCIQNYSDDNKILKAKIVKLLTDMEILLGLPVTFTSKIPMCVSEIIEKEKKQEQKGGVTHVK